jgi:RHS repeat-associated protein
MKNVILSLLALASVTCLAQTSTENYVRTEAMLRADSTFSMNSVQYFDGIGRPTLSVATTGGYGKSLYALTTYDALGREECRYLPVATDNSIAYKSPAAFTASSSSFYHNDGTAYTKSHYDVLDRVVSTELPGAAWRSADRRDRAAYGTNAAGEVLHYEAHAGVNSLTKPEDASYEYYPAGSLTRESRWDADSNRVDTFRDLYGNVVLQRVDTLCTYYVYDELGLLRYVLSPAYQKSGKKALHGYEYRYDERGRVVKKILPGAEYIRYWYDNADRVVCMQDGVMRSQGKYRFTVYDPMGRVAIQGLCSGYTDNGGMTATATYSGTSAGFLGTRYAVPSALAGALSGPQLEAVNYYDSHDFLSRNPNSRFTGMSITAAVSQTGQLTGSTSVASDGTWLSQVMAYDIKGNLIEMTSRELDGRTVTQQNSYTFTGNPASSSCTASVGYGSSLTLSEAVQYNAYNDKRQTYTLSVSHGGTASATMVYNYDSLGRASFTIRPFAGSGNRVVTYSYDMHGWLKGIATNSFREELYYADGPGTPCYNGNVSTMKWSNSGYPQKRGYRFSYDSANRLSSTLYGEREALDNKTGRYDEVLVYDANGNVRHLERRGLKQNGVFGKIDNLNLTYSGNHLVSVEEDALELLYAGSFDYKGSRGSYYQYNGNGSLTCDRSRGIAFIAYDLSGNPRKTYFTNGNVTEYVYSASGQKLRVKHYTAVPNITRPLGVQPPELTAGQILHTDVTDYLLGGRVTMRGGRVDKVLFEGGYCQAMQVSSSSDSFAFYYYNQDHLGNIREVVDASGTVQQVNNYYPFGTPYCDSPSAQSPDLQPYKYNGKELDRMHGLDTYDYGARQYDPVLCRWDRMDPLCEKYYGISPYAYCAGNPVKLVDPDGRKVVFVNGYLGFGSPEGGSTYWNGHHSSFVTGAQSAFKDYATPYFTNYDFSYLTSASIVREAQGYRYARDNYKALTKDMKSGVDKFNFVSHSMGGAFSEGMMRFLAEQGWETDNAVFLNAWEPLQISNKVEKNRIDATCTNDPVQFLCKPLFGEPDIPSSDGKIRIKSNESIMYIHRDLIDGNCNELWKLVNELLSDANNN